MQSVFPHHIQGKQLLVNQVTAIYQIELQENPCPHPIVILKDVAYVDLIAIVNFMYHGEVMVSEEQLPSFLQTATILQVSGLISNEMPCPLNRQSLPIKKAKPAHSEPHECPSKKIKASPKVHKAPLEENIVKKPIPQNLDTLLESEKIKSEKPEEMDEGTDQNLSKIQDLTEKMDNQSQSSILEAALEVKTGSILERSLTSQPTCKPQCIPTPCEKLIMLPDIAIPKTIFIPRKPPESEMERLILRSSSESSSSPLTFDRAAEVLHQNVKVESIEQSDMEVCIYKF